MFLYPKQGPRRQVGEAETILDQLSRQANQSSLGWEDRGLLQAGEGQVPGEPGRPWCPPFLSSFVLFRDER